MTLLTARHALDAGDIKELARLIDIEPAIIHRRFTEGELYTSGYFAGAMLLHHVAGNPIRCPLPANIVEVTGLLLDRGADPNARCGAPGQPGTVVGLVLTSRQAAEADVALPLIELLLEAGAQADLDSPASLTAPLWNHARGTAEALVRRGTPMDLPHAAALGRLAVVEELITRGVDQATLEEALIFAAVQGELESVRLLVEHGAKGDRIGRYGPGTALHEAANRGFADIVAVLLEHGADRTVVDRRFRGTPAEWAEHGRPEDLPGMLALLSRQST